MEIKFRWCYMCDGSVRGRGHGVIPRGDVVGAYQCSRCGGGGNIFKIRSN